MVPNMITTDAAGRKKVLRKEMMAKRKALSTSQKALAAADCLHKLLSMEEYKKADLIYAYAACRNELETKEIILKALSDEKRVALPKVEGDIMYFYEITSLEKDLEPGAFHILEPKEGLKRSFDPGLMLLPGLAFDKNNHRMGYGGGFYDKYLASHAGITAYALAYDFQLVPEVPCEEHDRLLDGIILGKTI